jgi:hypothetical protein
LNGTSLKVIHFIYYDEEKVGKERGDENFSNLFANGDQLQPSSFEEYINQKVEL